MATQRNDERARITECLSRFAGTLVGSVAGTGKRIVDSLTPASKGPADKRGGKATQTPAKKVKKVARKTGTETPKKKTKKVTKRKAAGTAAKSATSGKKSASSPSKKKKSTAPKKKATSRQTKKKTAKKTAKSEASGGSRDGSSY